MLEFIVDFEGYHTNKQFVIKELAIHEIDNNSFKNYFIKTYRITHPTYKWLIKHWHKIPFNYGQVSFSSIRKLFTKDDIYLVKGVYKKELLTKLFKHSFIYNLEEIFEIPKIGDLTVPAIKLKCSYIKHINCEHCALLKVYKLAYWYHNGKGKSSGCNFSSSIIKNLGIMPE